jgi:hypothetical protein
LQCLNEPGAWFGKLKSDNGMTMNIRREQVPLVMQEFSTNDSEPHSADWLPVSDSARPVPVQSTNI